MPKGKTYRKKKPYKKKAKTNTLKVGVKGSQEVLATKTVRPIRNLPIVWDCPNGGLPERVLVKMKFADTGYDLNPGAVSGQYALRANSIFDINLTGGGAQPTLHDAMATLYEVYRVHRFRVKWRLHNTVNALITVGLLVTDGTVTIQDPDLIRERCHVSTVLQANGQVGDNAVLSLDFKMKDYLGKRFADSTYASAFGTNPSDLVSVYLIIASDDGLTNPRVSHSYETISWVECRSEDLDRAQN